MEDYLIEFCSPTLASLKVGSLFNYAYTTRQELTEQLERLNDMLAEKGVFLRVLRVRKGRALIYLCRKSQLEALLRRPEIARFLAQYGYRELELEQVLWHLQCRVCCSEEFPHEIGVFLWRKSSLPSMPSAGLSTADCGRRAGQFGSSR